MKVTGAFIKQHILQAVSFLLFTGVFTLVLTLYGCETEAVIYAAVICGAIALAAAAVSFIRFRRRYSALSLLLDDSLLLDAPLPEAVTPETELYSELVTRLRDRCRELSNETLRDREEMLDYFTLWVHQIKIPIAVMRMTLDAEDSSEHRELSAELFRIEQYAELVLCYFRLDGQSGDLVARRTELDPVIRGAIRKYAPMFIRRRIRLCYEGTDEMAVTDEKWLGFIIEQLLSNAVKYTEGGSVTVAVRDNIITVSDTGIGIAPEDIPRLFERGYTGINGRADRRATGLGLYLVKKACGKLGIEIEIKSAPGRGTEVTLTLPRELAAE
ncbi:MAG: sensor histidine kinase [Ruminococcus sp.]|nr:sensor histidine kinase [Ruminococcus sp.]